MGNSIRTIEVEDGIEKRPQAVLDELTSETSLHFVLGFARTKLNLVESGLDLTPIRPLYLELLERGAAPALLTPQRQILTYSSLANLSLRVLRQMRSAGIQRHQCVVTLLENGPLAATVFVTLSQCLQVAPLNPAYRRDELAFYLQDLAPAMVVVEENCTSPIVELAQEMALPLVRIRGGECAGDFDLLLEAGQQRSGDWLQDEDIALFLHTSGTTSRPKLVPLTAANLRVSATNVAATLQLGPEDRGLVIMPLFHIHGLIAGTLASLWAGASLVSVGNLQTPSFFGWLQEFEANWYTAVPTMHQAILARAQVEGLQPGQPRLRFVRSSSASLPPSVMVELEKLFACPVVEAYGMTEATHQITSNRLPPSIRKSGSVGLAAGPEVQVMAPDGRFVGCGEVGEVVIRGDNVTQNYLNHPESTQEAFRSGWFRTGDQGYQDEDGYLFLTGRLKELINQGGEKISPRQIDEVLLTLPAVAQAVTFAVPDTRLGETVAAAVVLKANARVDERTLREWVRASLADFKVPRRIVFLDEIPKGPTGKIQRIGLAKQLGVEAGGESVQDSQAPRSEGADQLRRLAAEVLGGVEVEAAVNFLSAGGDSILAALLETVIRERLGKIVPAHEILEAESFESLAVYLQDCAASCTASPLPDCPDQLSPSQMRLWFLHRLDPSDTSFHRPIAFRLQGAISLEALVASLERLVERHPQLRSCYPVEGGLPRRAEQDFPCSLQELAPGAARLREFLQKPFDLQCGPVWRAAWQPEGANSVKIILVLHHIVCDAWSVENLLRDWGELLRGEHLPPLGGTYAQFVAWSQAELERSGEAGLAFWREELRDLPPALDLPLDSARSQQTAHGVEIAELWLDPQFTIDLQKLAGQSGTTLFSVLLTALQVLVQRLSGANQVAIGAFAANRPGGLELEGCVGLFLSTLVLHCKSDPDVSVRGQIQQNALTVRRALRQANYPFEKLVEALAPPRERGRSPLYQVFFNYRNIPKGQPDFGPLAYEPLDIDDGISQAQDLSLDVEPRQDGLRCRLLGRKDLLTEATLQAWLAAYVAILGGMASDAAMPLEQLPDGGSATLCGPPVENPAPCLLDRIGKWVERQPQATAVSSDRERWSYETLWREAREAAHWVLEQSPASGEVVGIYCGSSPWLLAAMLGCWMARVAIVLLPEELVSERLEHMLQDCGVRLLIAPPEQPQLPARLAGFERFRPLSQESPRSELSSTTNALAYVIYTSGSTGQPKGVEVTLSNLNHQLMALTQRFQTGPELVCLNTSHHTFDPCLLELLLPLTCGGRTQLVASREAPDADRLARTIQDCGATLVQLTPTLWRHLLGARNWPSQPLIALTGGEALEPQLARDLLARGVRLFNLYGPTETTLWTTVEEITDFNCPRVFLGKPLAGYQVSLLDGQGRPVIPGAIGEIVISGAGLSVGYRNLPEETASAFRGDANGRAYWTGDHARWSGWGGLEYRGRRDGQIKLQGVRVELAEVETIVTEATGRASVVRPARNGQSLVGYVQGPGMALGPLRQQLKNKLPELLIPSQWVFLPEFPRTQSGKVDRRQLPWPEVQRSLAPHAASGLEGLVLSHFQQVLQRPDMTVEGSFFEFGGHSLLATVLFSRLESVFQQELPLGWVFEAPSPRALVTLVEERREDRPSAIVPVEPQGHGAPLYLVHPYGAGVVLYRALAQRLQPEIPVYGIQPVGQGGSVVEMATRYVDDLLRFQPEGPYTLGGLSLGGRIAYEMGCMLRERGKLVRKVVLIDTYGPAERVWAAKPPSFADQSGLLLQRLAFHVGNLLWHCPWGTRVGYGSELLSRAHQALFARNDSAKLAVGGTKLAELLAHQPRCSDLSILLLRATHQPAHRGHQPCLGWSDCVQSVEVRPIRGFHGTNLVLREPTLSQAVVEMKRALGGQDDP